MTKEKYKRSKTEEREQKWSNKKMYGQYCRETSDDIDKEKRWLWLKNSDLKAETEALICAAQEQALRTNYIKFNIVVSCHLLLLDHENRACLQLPGRK